MGMVSAMDFRLRGITWWKVTILVLVLLAFGRPGTGLGLEVRSAQLNRWYDIRTPDASVNWPATPEMLRYAVRKTQPYISIYRFELEKGRKYTFQFEYPADRITGSACLRGINPLADSDDYYAPSGTTGVILCNNRGFPGGNIKGYVFGRKSNFVVSPKSRHNSAYLVMSSEKPRTPFRFRMIDPSESDAIIRKKGNYQLIPNRDTFYSSSNVYRNHFWLGYARGEPEKQQPGKTAAVAPKTTGAGGISVLPAKARYAPDEKITVRFSDLPGNQQDWITIVRKGSPADKYGQWYYTKGQKTGSFQFKGLQPGEYEVRVYLDWPSGGYNIAARQSLVVEPLTSTASTASANLNGQWELLDQEGEPYVWMALNHTGNRVSGRARYKNGSAAVKGTITGNRLKLDLVYDNPKVLEQWLPAKVCTQAVGVSSLLDLDLTVDPSAHKGKFYGFWVRWDGGQNITQKHSGGSPEALKKSKPRPRVLRRVKESMASEDVRSDDPPTGLAPSAEDSLWIEAENDKAHRVATSASARHSSYPHSGKAYWYLATGNDWIEYDILIPQAATYFIWIRDFDDQKHDPAVRSVVVSVNGRPLATVPAHTRQGQSLWAWSRVGSSHLSKGRHTLRITKERTTSGAALIDVIYVTSDRDALPPAAGESIVQPQKPMDTVTTADCRETAKTFLEAVRSENYRQARAVMTGEFQTQVGDQDLTQFRGSLMDFGQYQYVSEICERELGGASEAILVLKNDSGQKIMVQFAFIKDRIDQCIARWGVQ